MSQHSVGGRMSLRPSAVVAILLALAAPAYPAHPAQEGLFKEEWRTGVLGYDLARAGMQAVDLEGDGVLELVGAGSLETFTVNDYWWVLGFDPAAGAYRLAWISDVIPESFEILAVADIDADPQLEVLLGCTDGVLRVYDGLTLALQDTVDVLDAPVHQILVADADNDGSPEVVVAAESSTRLFEIPSLDPDGVLAYGGRDVRVGNVDGDPALETVLAGGVVLEVDQSGVSVEWIYPAGEFGRRLELADIDGDGMAEILAAASWFYITTFDADLQSPKWQYVADLDISSFHVRDISGDGVVEIFYGDAQFGALHCLDAISHHQLWQTSPGAGGVLGIAIGDLDADLDAEIAWAAGANSTDGDYIHVADIETQTVEWMSESINGPYLAVAIGDADGDGRDEIVTSTESSLSGRSNGVVSVYDAATHELKWRSDPMLFNGEANSGLLDIEIADIDSDPAPELLIGASQHAGGAVFVIDGVTHAVEEMWLYDDGTDIPSLALADVDRDSEIEIVAGAGQQSTGAPGVYVYVIDALTGNVEWNSINLGVLFSSVDQLAVANLDDDEALEIAAVNDWIFIIDGISHIQWQSPTPGYRGLDLYDVTGDGRPDIIAGTVDGDLVILDGATHAELARHTLSLGPVVGVRAYSIPPEDTSVVFASLGRVGSFDLAQGVTTWWSGQLARMEVTPNALAVGDIDNDRRVEIVVGGDHTVVQFEGPDISGLLFEDDFESGSLEAWSLSVPSR